jgi:hypothetical protein
MPNTTTSTPTGDIYKIAALRQKHCRIAEALRANEAEQRRLSSTGKEAQARAMRRAVAELRQDLTEVKSQIADLETHAGPEVVAALLAQNNLVPDQVAQIHADITKAVAAAAGKLTEFVAGLEEVQRLGADAAALVKGLVLQLPPEVRDRHMHIIEAAGMRDTTMGAAFEDTLRRLNFYSALLPSPWLAAPMRHDLPPMPEVAQAHAERTVRQVQHLVRRIAEGLRDD